MNKPFKPAGQVLRTTPLLHRLLKQAEQLSRLQELVYLYLAPAARDQLQLGNYVEGTLSLIVSDAGWATRLRYQQERLMAQLRQHSEFAGLQRVRIRVRPAGQPTDTAGETRRYLSETASEQIRQDAAHVTDPQLKAALERLAGNTAPDS